MPTLIHHFTALVEQYGILALFLSVTFESIGAPLPGESAILVASASAANGAFDIRSVALAAFAGAVLGDNIGYLIGRKLGRPVIVHHGARFGATEANMDRVEAVVTRHGALMVVFARFFVVLRQLNGIVAGTTGMRWTTFLVANMVGAAIWVGLWTTLAYRFGGTTGILPFFWHHLALIAAILTPLAIGLLAWLRWRQRHREAP